MCQEGFKLCPAVSQISTLSFTTICVTWQGVLKVVTHQPDQFFSAFSRIRVDSYRTRANRLISESNTTRGLNFFGRVLSVVCGLIHFFPGQIRLAESF